MLIQLHWRCDHCGSAHFHETDTDNLGILGDYPKGVGIGQAVWGATLLPLDCPTCGSGFGYIGLGYADQNFEPHPNPIIPER